MTNHQEPTFGNGKICYLEIPAIDVRQSAEFYDKVFGWRLRHNNDGSISFDDGVGQVSGMWILGRLPATVPGIMISIMVDDAAATLELIPAHGGKVIRPIGADAPEITALFTDPAGNLFSIYQHGGN